MPGVEGADGGVRGPWGRWSLRGDASTPVDMAHSRGFMDTSSAPSPVAAGTTESDLPVPGSQGRPSLVGDTEDKQTYQ